MNQEDKDYLKRAIELYLDHSYGNPEPIKEHSVEVSGKEITFKDCEHGPDTVSISVYRYDGGRDCYRESRDRPQECYAVR